MAHKRQKTSFDTEIKQHMCLNGSEDLIPIREGCLGYSLYDRLEDQVPRKVYKKRSDSEKADIDKILTRV